MGWFATGRSLQLFAGLLVWLVAATAWAQMEGIEEQVASKALRDALVSEAVLIVYGTGGNEEVTAQLETFAEELKAELEAKQVGQGWPITLRADGDVSLPELGGCFLFLVGTPESNVILTLYEGSFPLGIDAAGVSVGKARFDGTDLAATFAMINPFNPQHYAVIYTGVTDTAVWTAPNYAYDEIGYVVVGPGGVRARGQFDTTIPEYWTILPGAGVKQVGEQLVGDAVAIGLDFKPAEPLPGMDGKSVFMLGYDPEGGVVEHQEFLLPYLQYLHTTHGVRMIAIEAPMWMSEHLDAYVVDGTTPPGALQLPEETAAFLADLRSYNKGLSGGKRIHVASFDLNHDVFTNGSQGSLLPLKTWVGQLKDRETRKALSQVMADVGVAYEGGNPAAMLEGINKLNEGVAVAALKKKLPAELYPRMRAYLDTEKTSIYYHHPENRMRRDTSSLREARARILRKNMTEVITRSQGMESPALFFLAAEHCNKGAPGASYGRIPLAQYFDKYYEPTWEKVHVTVACALTGGYYDFERGSSEVVAGGFTPDQFESQVASFRQPNSLVYVPFQAPFWTDSRMTVGNVWTWPSKLYDGMAFFFDVRPASGKVVPLPK